MTDGAMLRRFAAGVGSACSFGTFPPSARFVWRRQSRDFTRLPFMAAGLTSLNGHGPAPLR